MDETTDSDAGLAQEAPQKKSFSWKKLLKILGVFVVLFVVFVAAVAGQVREKARRINCAGNLKCIALGLIIYAGDDSDYGFFPSGTSFRLLDEGSYSTNGKVYTCPAAAVPNTLAAESNFVYLGDGICDRISNASKVPLGGDRAGNHSNWINVMFADGHVKGYKAESWEALMLEQGWDKEVEAARAESGGRQP